MPETVSSDTGPFAIVPEWVLDHPGLSPRAIHVYCLLARYSDDSGSCFPGRKTLWKRAHCSEHTLDAALRELVNAHALLVTHRLTEKGDRTSNEYRVLRVRPRGMGQFQTPPGAISDTTGGAETDVGTRATLEREPLNDMAAPAAPSPRRRTDPRANVVTVAWWNTRNPKPLQPFVNIRGIVDKALKAGHTEEAVLEALLTIGDDPPVIGWKLDQALSKRRPKRRDPRGLNWDRNAG